MTNKTKHSNITLDEHIKENKLLDWDELSYKIICLESELHGIINYIDSKAKNIYEQVIDDCEAEKALRVSKLFSYSKHLQKQIENEMFFEEDEENN